MCMVGIPVCIRMWILYVSVGNPICTCYTYTSMYNLCVMYVVSKVFVVWAVGRSQNRSNWGLTTMKRLRNVLHLIALFAHTKPRDVRTLDPGSMKGVFMGCNELPDNLNQI